MVRKVNYATQKIEYAIIYLFIFIIIFEKVYNHTQKKKIHNLPGGRILKVQPGPAVELSDSNGLLLKEWILSSSMKLFVNICVQVASLFFYLVIYGAYCYEHVACSACC